MRFFISDPSTTGKHYFSATKTFKKKQKWKKVVGFITPKTLTRSFHFFSKITHASDLAVKKIHTKSLFM